MFQGLHLLDQFYLALLDHNFIISTATRCWHLGLWACFISATSSRAAPMTAALFNIVVMTMSWLGQSTKETCLISFVHDYFLAICKACYPLYGMDMSGNNPAMGRPGSCICWPENAWDNRVRQKLSLIPVYWYSQARWWYFSSHYTRDRLYPRWFPVVGTSNSSWISEVRYKIACCNSISVLPKLIAAFCTSISVHQMHSTRNRLYLYSPVCHGEVGIHYTRWAYRSMLFVFICTPPTALLELYRWAGCLENGVRVKVMWKI